MDVRRDSAAKPSILVVDDSEDILALMVELLRSDYQVKLANGGERALKLAAQEPHPDLILLDIMMPDMDGYEVCQRLKANPQTRDIPVVFLTAKTDVEDEKRGLELGAVDYISKPVSPPIVLARVRTQVTLAQRNAMLRSLPAKLSRYLPPQVYQSIFEGRQEVAISARRRRLTIFFSDIKDFTEITEDMEAEDLTWLINDYFSEMSRIALEYGATIDKFIGDAMLMFFGDPSSRGEREDALQCVRMAVAMQRRMSVLQRKWADRGFNRPFHMRVGINTGYCNVGNFGSEQRMDYTIIGGAVNLAARLQQMGEPDGVLLAYKTNALIQGEFLTEESTPLHAKGFAREVRCFALRGVSGEMLDSESRMIRRRTGLQLDLDTSKLDQTGRDESIEDLSHAIERLRRAG